MSLSGNPDEREKLAAIYLGILNHQFSGQEVRNYLKEVKPDIFTDTCFLRELGYIDKSGNILDENGNIIKDDGEH